MNRPFTDLQQSKETGSDHKQLIIYSIFWIITSSLEWESRLSWLFLANQTIPCDQKWLVSSLYSPHSAEHNTRYFPASAVGKDEEPKGLETLSSGSPAGTELQAKQCGERTENLSFGQFPFRVVTATKERPDDGNLAWEKWVGSRHVGWSASTKCSEKRQFSVGSWNALKSSKRVCQQQRLWSTLGIFLFPGDSDTK